jgi:hypothetical protein
LLGKLQFRDSELHYRTTSDDTASAGRKVEGRITVLLACSMVVTIISSLY